MVRHVSQPVATALRLQLSDPAPSETAVLLNVINEVERPGSDLITPFDALLTGALVGRPERETAQQAVQVLAVLERTAVVGPAECTVPAAGDRALARLSELIVDRSAIRWSPLGEELRFGFDGKVSARGRRRCPRCGRVEGETDFRAYRTSYCIDCAREVSREHRRRRARRMDEAA